MTHILCYFLLEIYQTPLRTKGTLAFWKYQRFSIIKIFSFKLLVLWQIIYIQFSYNFHLFYCREGENGRWDQLPQIVTKTNITSYQVTGLTPFTVYSFRLLAVNNLGISLPSKESYYIVTLREGKSHQSCHLNDSKTIFHLLN